MTRTEKLQAIQRKVQKEKISLKSIVRGTALSINTVRAAIQGEPSTTDSTINFLYLYLGIESEQRRIRSAVQNSRALTQEVPA